MNKRNKKSRPYRQIARASAAEATGERILGAVLRRFQEQWLEEVTLDAIAKDAGVTVQTVIRRFGPKDQLLDAAAEQLNKEVTGRRTVKRGDAAGAIDALTADYEASGDLVWRFLAQEERYPLLKTICDRGRRYHREWLARVFEPWLDPRDTRAFKQRLDALVAATDVFLWKLLRRDLGRSIPEYKGCVSTLLSGVLPADVIAVPSATRPRKKESV